MFVGSAGSVCCGGTIGIYETSLSGDKDIETIAEKGMTIPGGDAPFYTVGLAAVDGDLIVFTGTHFENGQAQLGIYGRRNGSSFPGRPGSVGVHGE